MHTKSEEVMKITVREKKKQYEEKKKKMCMTVMCFMIRFLFLLFSVGSRFSTVLYAATTFDVM